MSVFAWSEYEDGPYYGFYNSREEAAAMGFDACPDADVICTGAGILQDPGQFVDADALLDSMDELAFDELGGDDWDRWPNLNAEQMQEFKAGLVDYVKGFLEKHSLGIIGYVLSSKDVMMHWRPKYEDDGEE